MQARNPIVVDDSFDTMGSADAANLYDLLRPIMDVCGATWCSPAQFYWEVNLAYHEAEAPLYEQVHRDMFSGLRAKWERLVSPLRGAPIRSLRWLDVGCGTGLVGSFLVELLGDRIREGVLVDPSIAMIEECRRRARDWPFDTSFAVGTIESLPKGFVFDLVTVDSVMHHIVELESFCKHLASLARAGGVLLTCQDSRGEASSDLILKARAAFAQCLHPQLIRYHLLSHLPKSVLRTARNFKKKWTGTQTALRSLVPQEEDAGTVFDAVLTITDATNRRLMGRDVISKPLSSKQIWAVTDFHVPGQPGNIGKGIRLDFLKGQLSPLQLEDYFTYAFFGGRCHASMVAALEDELFQRSDGHGLLFGSRWRKPGFESL